MERKKGEDEQEPVMNVLASTPTTYGSIDQPPEIVVPPVTIPSENADAASSQPSPQGQNLERSPWYYTVVSIAALIAIFLVIRVIFLLLNVNIEPRPVDTRFPIDR